MTTKYTKNIMTTARPFLSQSVPSLMELSEPAVPWANLGFRPMARVLGNQLLQSPAIPLIGLLPPRTG